MRNRTLLVTGGAGFIGSCLIRQLIAESHTRVVNLDKLTYAGNLDSLQSIADCERYAWVQGDICDEQLVAELLRKHRPCGVMHLAAESHVDRSIDDPRAFVNTNVSGTFTLLEACRKYWMGLPSDEHERFRFLHVSTDEVYGSLGTTGYFTETSPYSPNSPYSASKAASDHFVRAYYHSYGLPTLVTNCSNNYGPFQFPEKLIPLMILNAVEGKMLPVYGDGLNVRDWLYVEDHCRALRLVFAKGRPGEVYNIGGACEQTNISIVKQICVLVDKLRAAPDQHSCENLITYVKDRPGHDRRYAVDITKISRELMWRPHWSFETGLAQTVQWYLDNSCWVHGVTSGKYRGERLGLKA